MTTTCASRGRRGPSSSGVSTARRQPTAGRPPGNARFDGLGDRTVPEPVEGETLHREVQLVLERVRALRRRDDLLLALVRDPGLDQVGREHAASGQELVVCLERKQ